jgi:uncharacterized protein
MEPFQVLVKPAAGDCNLGCDYCFYRRTTPELYPFEKKHRMDREVMEILVKDMLSYRFSETIFCWQGGEPTLMGLDFFEDVIETQMKHGKAGQVVGNAFQTNGILIGDAWARFLAEYKVVVGLSLDGPRSVHDNYRKSLGGAGTFERVMETAELFLRYGVAFNILCVVNGLNQDQGRTVYRFFRNQGFDYIQFIPCLETDPATGEALPFSATPDGLARFFREVFEEYERDGFPHVSERNFDALMNLHLSGKPNMCTFDGRCGGYLVVEYNGDVYPCDFFVESDWNLGNIRDKKLAEFFDHPLMKSFAKAKDDRPAECDDCRWLKWCYGGCLKDRLPDRAGGTGRTWFCEAYRELFGTSYETMEQWCGMIKDNAGEGGRAPSDKKAGRNDPCPCGSGRKYKKCCGKDN